MGNLWSNIMIVLIAVGIITGCHDDNNDGAVVNPSIKGYVVLYGESVTPLDDSSGVTITTRGPVYDSVVTASGGKWNLTNLRTGVYSIIFSKPGFGIDKVTNVKLTGNNGINLGRIIVVQKPAYKITSFAIAPSDTGFQISGDLALPPGSNGDATIVFFMDTTNLVSSDPFHYIGLMETYTHYPSTTYSLYVTKSALQNLLSLFSGTQVYVATYPASALFAFSGYPDTASGNWAYTAIGDSSKVSWFTMP
jgi:hypothetical protein